MCPPSADGLEGQEEAGGVMREVQGALFGDEKAEERDAEIGLLVKELWQTQGWPRDEERDRALIGELLKQFPGLDLHDELGKFRVWILSQTDEYKRKRVTSRGRWQTLRNWCKSAVRGSSRSAVTAGEASGRQRRTSTAPRPAEAWGETSQTLTGW